MVHICTIRTYVQYAHMYRVCCAVAFRADVGGDAVERHTQPVPQAAADSPGRVDGDPDQQMEPRSASPQHEVEQSRGPVQEKQERLASVEVEANEQFVLSTMWSATESSPGVPTRKPIVRSTIKASQVQGSSCAGHQLTDAQNDLAPSSSRVKFLHR